MITKELNTVRKCCLYASDFHLEMILLPYVRERISNSSFIIYSQNDLSNTIKILLDRVNINKKEKEEILNLNWKKSNKECINSINNLVKDNKDITIIINGDCDYIEAVNCNLNLYDNKNVQIIDCFNINDKNLNMENIKSNYKEILNTSKI